MPVKGVDVSEHNGSVDFAALKAAGVGFVIIRCGYGSDYTNQDDSRFSENVRKAESAGMPWGVYLYSYAKTTAMAKSEAAHTLRLLAGRKPLYGVWYDVEDPQLSGCDVVSTSKTFCDAMEAAGLYAGIYASLSWLNGALNSSKLDAYDKWVAQWSASCTYKKAYGIWQYTDKLVIGGKAFDGNYAYKDYPAIVRGMNGSDAVDKEEADMTEAQVKNIVKAEIESYFKAASKKPVSDWAADAVNSIISKGIMTGDDKDDPMGSFRPQASITRQEAAIVADNIVKYMESAN